MRLGRSLSQVFGVACVLFSATAASAAPKFSNLKVSSTAFKQGGLLTTPQVFNGMGCTGGNQSPDLIWSKPPDGTKSIAVSLYDPDAPTGSGFWHWVVFNIPPDVTTLKVGAGNADGSGLPPGAVQSRTDFGKPGYGGPCPPAGDKPHRYIFKVFALKDTIPLDKDATAAMVGFYANQMKLAEGVLQGKYARP